MSEKKYLYIKKELSLESNIFIEILNNFIIQE